MSSTPQRFWAIKFEDGKFSEDILAETEEEAKQQWKGNVIDKWETCERLGASCVQVELLEVKP